MARQLFDLLGWIRMGERLKLLQVSEGDSQRIQEILAHPDDWTIEKDIESRLWVPLRQGTFVLDDEVDELEILKARNRMDRRSRLRS